MTHLGCSLLDCALVDDRTFEMDDYAGAKARWCPGCGDHSVLTQVERLLEAEQLRPEQTVFVSGIGCSSRFPHYLKTYGFHGLHGRALPVATGVKLNRPDLDVFVVMGDGDCCSIGAGHWVHAIRYNLDMVTLLLDNAMYGLTKGQTSPTTPEGFPTNTQPEGTYLQAINPLTTTLGVTNASFVAQTAEWIPAHLYETLSAAYRHRGFAFVRILQRCPVYTAEIFEQLAREPDSVELLVHEDGVRAEGLESIYKHTRIHDPADLNAARQLADENGLIRLGVLYSNAETPRYENLRATLAHTAEERAELLNAELDHYAI